MLIKRIRTKIRPNTTISWSWTDDVLNEIIRQNDDLEYSLVQSGVISSISNIISEDGLTHRKEYTFSSIENLVSCEKQMVDLDASTGCLANYLQHYLDNGITYTTSYVFEN